MLYYPLFEEEELLLGESHYKHAYHKVIDVVRKNAQKYKRWRTAVKDAENALYHEETEELVRKAEERFGKNSTFFDDEECNQESAQVTSTVENEEECFSSRIRIPCTMSNEDFRTLVASLNEKQQKFFFTKLCFVKDIVSSTMTGTTIFHFFQEALDSVKVPHSKLLFNVFCDCSRMFRTTTWIIPARLSCRIRVPHRVTLTELQSILFLVLDSAQIVIQ